jgi:uncharacterized protein (TIGR00255 family)
VIVSMTGYGRGEVSKDGVTAHVEVRSVNTRHLETTVRLPRSMAHREGDIKEIVRASVMRGKISITVTVHKETNETIPLVVNTSAARSYYKLLNQLRKAVKIREEVKLQHLLQFSEILEATDGETSDEAEWACVSQALTAALDALNAMRTREGQEMAKDLAKRIRWMGESVDDIERLAAEKIPEERTKLQERVAQLATDPAIIDQKRLELEIILLADKLDITEECVRFRSHVKFFLESMSAKESAGRKLNFLVQEINREANTIGSKSSDADIAHRVVRIKEELEKIREQLQNIE